MTKKKGARSNGVARGLTSEAPLVSISGPLMPGVMVKVDMRRCGWEQEGRADIRRRARLFSRSPGEAIILEGGRKWVVFSTKS